MRKRRQHNQQNHYYRSDPILYDTPIINNAEPGCPILPTCALLGADYCLSGQLCQDFWKGPFCVCPEDQIVSLAPDGTLGKCNDYSARAQVSLSSKAMFLILLCIILLISKFNFFLFFNLIQNKILYFFLIFYIIFLKKFNINLIIIKKILFIFIFSNCYRFITTISKSY